MPLPILTPLLLGTLLALPQEAKQIHPRALTEAELAGQQKMLDVLAKIRAGVPDEHPFLETKTLRELLPLIEKLDPQKQPLPLFRRLTSASAYQLREGKNADAIASLRRALELCPRLPENERTADELQAHYELGVAYMRMGEAANCVAHHTSQSCLLPIAEGGIHIDQEGSRGAVEQFRAVFQHTEAEDPRHVAAQWLLNIAYMTLGGYPKDVPAAELIDPAAFRSKVPFPHFPEIAAKLGLNAPDISGSVIPEDFDHDGDVDLMTCCWDPREDLSYFENQGGQFVERSDEKRLTGISGGLNMCQADYNNDGEIDVIVMRGAWLQRKGKYPKSLLRNQGDGTFLDVTFAAGMGTFYPQHSAAWFDYDRDGDLDVYVGSESQADEPFPSELFQNQGDGTFVDVAKAAGVDNLRWAKGVTAGDYDNDGNPDLYVSNFGSENRLYHNDGNGTFQDVAPSAGVMLPITSFATWFWDYDNDGNLDIFAAQYSGFADTRRVAQAAAHYLGLSILRDPMRVYKGDGKGGFQDVSEALGVDFSPQPMGANFGDLDNDGYLDFYLSTGYPGLDGLVPNIMLHNVGGKKFDDVTFAGGFGHLQKGHGVAFTDLDNDGDQDVFSQMGGAYASDGFGDVLFENPGFGNHWLRLTLVGTEDNRSAIGARIRVDITEGKETRSVWRDVNSGGSFGSNSLTQHIGLGQATKVDRLEIRWPRSGKVQTFRDVPADRQLRIVEGKETLEPVAELHLKLGG